MSILGNRITAVVAGAAVIATLGGTAAFAADQLTGADIKDGSLQPFDFNSNVQSYFDNINTKSNENKVAVNGLKARVDSLEGAPELGGLAASATTAPNRVGIEFLGGTILNNATNRGVTHVTSIDLEPGTYLVSAYGHFDRKNDNQAGYTAPTTDTYGALALWTGAEQFTDFAQAAGTYFTGNISPRGFIEATASGSQVIVVEEATTLHVGGFAYNEDRSSWGSADSASGAQFDVLANVSAVKVG